MFLLYSRNASALDEAPKYPKYLLEVLKDIK